jgi:hypothetical protein
MQEWHRTDGGTPKVSQGPSRSQAMHPRRHRGPIRHGQRASLCALTGPRSCEASAGWGGAVWFLEPRVLARVALLDVSLVREAWRHSWTSIPNLGRALPQKPREKGGFQLHSVSTDGGGQSRKVLFRAHLARPPQLHRPFFTLSALPMLVMCFSSVFPFGTVGTVSPLDPPSSRQHWTQHG